MLPRDEEFVLHAREVTKAPPQVLPSTNNESLLNPQRRRACDQVNRRGYA